MGQTRASIFDAEKQELGRWPYTRYRVDETLDDDLISDRARQLLYQSIAREDLVAFLGSGVPMAYGRTSWNDWLKLQFSQIHELASLLLKCAERSIECIGQQVRKLRKLREDEPDEQHNVLYAYLLTKHDEISFQGEAIKRLYKTFSAMRPDDPDSSDDFADKEAQIVFEIAEQLQTLLLESIQLFVDPDNFEKVHLRQNPGFNSQLPHARGPESAFSSWYTRIFEEKKKKALFKNQRISLAKYYWSIRELSKFLKRPRARLSISDYAKVLLVDETSHAEQLLIEGLEGREDASDQLATAFKACVAGIERNRLGRQIDGIRDDPDRYWSLAFFNNSYLLQMVKKLLKNKGLSGELKEVLREIQSQLETNKKPKTGPMSEVEREIVSPPHRFVLKLMLEVADDPSAILGLGKGDLEDNPVLKGLINELITAAKEARYGRDPKIKMSSILASTFGKETESEFAPINRDSFLARSSIMDMTLDPLDKLVIGLGVRRFLTLNYDFEVERYFEDRGYAKFSEDPDAPLPSDDVIGQLVRRPNRVDGFGGVLRDETFRRERSNELVNFAVEAATADASIFHLHGRATRRADLVIKERDYMNLYLRDDEHREAVDESIRLTFSANTMLFAGLGMREADVLRPLRQFMSDKDRDRAGTAVVLMPGFASPAQRRQEAGLHYLRYGVHTIHFGDAWRTLTGNNDLVRIPWAHMAVSLLGELRKAEERAKKAAKKLLELENKPTPANPEEVNKLDFAIQEATEDWDKETRRSKAKALTKLRETLGFTAVREVQGGETKEVKYPVFDLLLRQNLGQSPQKEFEKHAGNYETQAVDIFKEAIGPAKGAKKKGKENEHLPIFSTVKPSSRHFERHRERTAAYLDFEIKMLRHLVGWCSAELPKSPEEAQHEVKARLTAIDGVNNSLTTALLTLALEYLRLEKNDWAANWQKSPPERLPRFREIGGYWPQETSAATEGQIKLPKLYVRHELLNTISPMPERPKSRLYDPGNTNQQPTGIRAYDHFVSAIKERRSIDPTEHGKGRRMYLVCAYRGMGKGSFMTAMMSDAGMVSYISAHKTARNEPPVYIGGIFINLSFSSEIASVFDMLIHSVAECTGWVQSDKSHRDDYKERRDKLLNSISDLPRTGKIKRILREFDIASRALPAGIEGAPRILMCINAVDLLHFSRGLIKNREIEEILSFLTGPATKDCLFDLVMISGELRVSEVLTGRGLNTQTKIGEAQLEEPERRFNAPHLQFVPITADDIALPGVHNVRQRMARSDLDFRNWPLFAKPAGKGVCRVRLRRSYEADAPIEDAAAEEKAGPAAPFNSDEVCYVHYTRPVRPETLLIDNFRCLAYFLMLGELERVLEEPFVSMATELLEATPGKLDTPTAAAQKANRHPRLGWGERDTVWKSEFSSSLLRQIWRSKRNDRDRVVDAWICQLFENLQKNDWRWFNAPQEFIDKFKASEKSLKSLYAAEPSTLSERLANLFLSSRYVVARSQINDAKRESDSRPDWGRTAREWQEVRVTLRDNRFCMTILFAAAERMALHARTVRDGFLTAESFLTTTIDRVKIVSGDKREQVVISAVLDSYEAYHKVGSPSDDLNLHLLLLRHMAVIGAPVSADVLVLAPEVRRYFEKLYSGHERSRELRVVEALTELADRGLVFELAEHPRISRTRKDMQELIDDAKDNKEKRQRHSEYLHGTKGGGQATDQRRYALHRAMQRHVIKKMGSGPRDTMEMNQFAPSIFASMPADLPRLNRESYDFLNTLVEHFSEYPDYSNAVPGPQNWHQRSAPINTRVQALRAALSIIRSTFSIAVVSRFEDYAEDDHNAALTQRGYFGKYRVQVRWIIRKAFELLYDESKDDKNYIAGREDFKHINALYIDEIVWLYNECGLVNYVQGNLNDANALLLQAITLNRRVEGEVPGGPQYNRIALNLALVSLERGRIDRARDMFNSIRRTETQNNRMPGRIYYIATGYLGLVHHILGEREVAAAHYKQAISVLRRYADSRACAIFLRHAGDLQRSLKDYDQSERMLLEAQSFAHAGGHQDVEQRCALSLVRWKHEKERDSGQRPDIRSLIIELNTIADYARRMEMPSLSCDVMVAHAEMLIEDGESSQSGRLMSRAMTLSKRNGMTLRLTTALVRYAHVLALRGLKPQSNRLLFYALDMAKRSRNQLEIKAINSVFAFLHRN
ncbi:MAG: SIR2 family protein [Pseudomonadota bacterium]